MLLWAQNGNGCQFAVHTLLKWEIHLYVYKRHCEKKTLLTLLNWLICHTFLTLVTLFRKLAIDIGFTMEPFREKLWKTIHERKTEN